MNQRVSADLQEFHEFISRNLANGDANLSPEEVLDCWRATHPDADDLLESATEIRQALADMSAGDHGRPVDEVLAEIRARYNLPSL